MKHWNIKMSAQENMLRLLRYVTETIVRLRPCCHCGPLIVLRRPLYFFVAATRNITLGDGHLIAVGPKFAVPFWQTGSLLCTLSQYIIQSYLNISEKQLAGRSGIMESTLHVHRAPVLKGTFFLMHIPRMFPRVSRGSNYGKDDDKCIITFSNLLVATPLSQDVSLVYSTSFVFSRP